MTRINGTEPDHWHDEHGRHAMTDPRTVYGAKWVVKTGDYTSRDEREYVRHLMTHELDTDPHRVARRDDDFGVVQALFDKIDANDAANAKMRELIVAYRREAAEEDEPDPPRNDNT